MKRNQVMATMAGMALAAVMVFTMAGCTKTVSAAAYKTVNGVTEGNYEVSTDDKGSASFNIEGNHVELTNFTFDADPALKVEAEINEEDIVFTHVYVHDDESVMQNVADGLYREPFTKENAAKEFNTLYKAVFGATDEPVVDENVNLADGLLVTGMNLTDGQLFILAKEGTNQFIMIAATTMEYGSQDLIDTAVAALEGETAPAAEE